MFSVRPKLQYFIFIRNNIYLYMYIWITQQLFIDLLQLYVYLSSIYKVVISVCTYVCLIITVKRLDRSVPNFHTEPSTLAQRFFLKLERVLAGIGWGGVRGREGGWGEGMEGYARVCEGRGWDGSGVWGREGLLNLH